MRSNVPMDILDGRAEQDELVPLAEFDATPEDFVETHQETVWYNPLERDYALDLYVGTQPMGPNHKPRSQPRPREALTGVRRYVIKSKQRRAIPAEFDIAIQHLQCTEPQCSLRSHHCKNPRHRRVIVGGLGPHLVNMGLQLRPTMVLPLNEAEAEKKLAAERAMKSLQEAHAAKEALAIAQAALEERSREAEQQKARAAKAEAELRAVPKQTKKDQ